MERAVEISPRLGVEIAPIEVSVLLADMFFLLLCLPSHALAKFIL